MKKNERKEKRSEGKHRKRNKNLVFTILENSFIANKKHKL